MVFSIQSVNSSEILTWALFTAHLTVTSEVFELNIPLSTDPPNSRGDAGGMRIFSFSLSKAPKSEH